MFIRALNTVLFLRHKYQGNRESAFQRLPKNYYLNHVLDSKQGNCFSMPLLYVAVSDRLAKSESCDCHFYFESLMSR